MNNWQEFLDKIVEAKKHKIKGLSAPVIYRLIFAGTFDSILTNPKITHETYKRMCEDVGKALKSKAKLPKKGKNQAIGIDEIDSDIKMHQWRAEVSPTFKFSIHGMYKNQFISLGYLPFNTTDERYKYIKYTKEIKYSPNFIEKIALIESWSDFWKLPDEMIYKRFLDQNYSLNGVRYKYTVAFIGFVIGSELRRFGAENKEMMKVKLYLGSDYTEELIHWPEKDGKIREDHAKKLVMNRPVLVKVQMTISQGKYKGGKIEDVHAFTV